MAAEAPTDGGSRQLIGLRILLAWNFPETCLDAEVVNLATEVVKLPDKVFVENGLTGGTHVAVSTPLDDPVGQAVDHVRGVGFDDNIVDAVRVREFTVEEEVSKVAESADGGGELSALTGWVVSVTELERPIVPVVGAPVDTASREGVLVAVVSTRTVSGDEDAASRVVLAPQALAGVMHAGC
jgi:hypothetical protein